jgi:hypothetical protein
LEELVSFVERPESMVEHVWKSETERFEEWRAKLREICNDAIKASDRLVRLNAATERRLATVLDTARTVDVKALAQRLTGESTAPLVTPAQRAAANIRRLCKSIGPWSYLEWPWR